MHEKFCHHLKRGNAVVRYLVTERLGGDEGDLLTYPLVGIEVKGKLGVIFFNNDTSCLLNGFGPDTSHGEELEGLKNFNVEKLVVYRTMFSCFNVGKLSSYNLR